jgi:hypothetical protein
MNSGTADKVTKTSVLVDGKKGREAAIRCAANEWSKWAESTKEDLATSGGKRGVSCVLHQPAMRATRVFLGTTDNQ